MADEKPLTISSLIAALKEAGFATKDDLNELRKQVADDGFEARAKFFQEMTKPEMQKQVRELRDMINSRFDNSETEATFIKRDITDIKAVTSTIPSRGEFQVLRKRVGRLEERQLVA